MKCRHIGYIDPGGSQREEKKEIVEATKKLPSTLRKHCVDSLFRRPATVLCRSHKKLNPDVIGYVFDLLQGEVTVHIESLCWYHEVLKGKSRELVDSLRDIQYMWVPSRRGTVPYQQNRCEACILARIATRPVYLMYLRTTLLSRIATRRNHWVPRLLPFIEESMACHKGHIGEIHYRSGEWAKILKHQRKHAQWALMSSNPIASLKQDIRCAEEVTVPLGIDLKTLESSQRDQQNYDGHREPDTIVKQALRRHVSDTDTLAGIIGLYNECRPLDWTSPPTPCTIENQSDRSSITYINELPVHAPPISPNNAPYLPPLAYTRDSQLVHSQPFYKRKAPAKRLSDDMDEASSRSWYIPPQEEIGWKDVLGKPTSLYLLANENPTLWQEGRHGGCEQLADQYRGLLSPAMPYYASDYGELSPGTEDENPMEKQDSQNTNWSYLFQA
ncbi:hypothetical protein BDV28DRAFT_11637 [Aspergillus coremiiformis]|uniref:Uncharacterized protein n=1 Tax=Aspergillus coremiiformis TaxID=138285 RepID=A0A5N6ZGC3_9EURO|nr:hypothetical protein BDV28DRAFT_11637 [Aspergillus coremiiformis]